MTSSPAEGEALVRALFKAIDADDEQASDALIANDICFRFGNGPEVTNKRSFVARRGPFRSSVRTIRHDIVWIGHLSDVVVAEMRVTYTRHDGSTVTLPCCNTFRIRDGLIVDYRIYMDISPVVPSVAPSAEGL
jgi:ketosteroid isomerase-like protein